MFETLDSHAAVPPPPGMPHGFDAPGGRSGPAEHLSGIPRITLRQLVYFAAAARLGSALRAAEELSISPPAISSAIAGLESLLGEQLFVRWHTDGHPQLMSQLEEGTLDVIFVLDFEISPTLSTTVLCPGPVRCVLPASHWLANDTVDLAQLEDMPFIMLDIPKTRDYFLSVFASLGLKPNIAHRVTSAEMVRGLVASGFGYSLLNFGSHERKDIVYRPIRGYTRTSQLVAVRQYRHPSSELIEAFVAKAGEFLSQHGINPDR